MSIGHDGAHMSRRAALRLTAVVGASFALGGGLTGALLRQAGVRRRSETRTHLGTRVSVTVHHRDGNAARDLVEATFAEISRLEGILSRHRADSSVSTLEREGYLHGPSPDLTTVLRRAAQVSELSGGAFDVTVAPLLRLYQAHFQRGAADDPPGSLVDEALALVDFRKVEVSDDMVRLLAPGMALTLDGIAKGYVVDRAVATLVGGGADQVVVEAGGDLAVRGMTSPHPVAVQDPRRPDRSLGTLLLRGEGVASSGDYVQAFTADRRSHHILDPRSGLSPADVSGVTVVASSAMDADALSTAAFVLGPVEGLALLDGLEGVEGLVVTKNGHELRTTRLSTS